MSFNPYSLEEPLEFQINKFTDCVILDPCVRFVVCLQEPTHLLVALLNARELSKLPCLRHTVFVSMMLVCGGDTSPVHLTNYLPATINVGKFSLVINAETVLHIFCSIWGFHALILLCTTAKLCLV